MFQAGQSASQDQGSSQGQMCMKQTVQKWYPGWMEETYFIPPVHMNLTQHQEMEVAGETVYVPQAPVSN